MTYTQQISQLCMKVQEKLAEDFNVNVDFEATHVTGRRPGDANSEFLSNRGMGDWAETTLRKGLSAALKGYHVLKYGNDDTIIAGQPNFPEFYTNYQTELATTGKRPDLLIFDDEHYHSSWGGDISHLTMKSLGTITPDARWGIEVRSSKFFADEYAKIRAAELAERGSVARSVQSFTIKVEDLRIVKRWIDSFSVRHFYCQVFFDSVYAISFRQILSLVAYEADGISVEENRRNQDKPTIHVPVSHGQRIGIFENPPEFVAKTRKTHLARLDAYVQPVGGDLVINSKVLRALLESSDS